MDHLPRPLHSDGSPIEVPFVANIPWDYLNFDAFPSRNGFPVSRENGTLLPQNLGVQRLAALIQSWLYFGLLSEVLGENLRTENFCSIRPASTGKLEEELVDSSSLESLLSEWTKRFRHKKNNSRRQVLNRGELISQWKKLKDLLKSVRQACRHIERASVSQLTPIPEIIFSVEILCLTFEHLCSSLAYDGRDYGSYIAFHRQDPGFAVDLSAILRMPEDSDTRMSFPSTQTQDLIRRKMVDAGWCISIVENLFKEYDLALLYYLSQMRMTYNPRISHQGYTQFSCTANHVDEDHYENRHVTEDCDCQLISASNANKTKMFEIIKDGGVPLIQIKEAPYGNVELAISRHKPGLTYFAISHVWSDGLGNPNSNALPLCQLQKLAGLLRHHPKSTNTLHYTKALPQHFWMDTLCIPSAKEEHPLYSLRLDCIDRMGFIYASAWRVLVLDSGLQQIRLATSSSNEVDARLVCSAWNQRCWTLQEGAVAPAVSFQLSDGVYDPDPRTGFTYAKELGLQSGRIEVQNLLSWLIWTLFGWKLRPETREASGISCTGVFAARFGLSLLMSIDRSLRSTSKLDFSRSDDYWGTEEVDNRQLQRFVGVWNELRKRTTTKPEDLYVIFANLLSFRPSQLLAIEKERWIRELILNISRVPRALLFNTGKRFSSTLQSEDRWIPKEVSKMSLDADRFMEKSGQAFKIGDKEPEKLPGLLVLTPAINADTHSLRLRCTHGSCTDGTDDVYIHVDFFRFTGDQFDSREYESSYILIDNRTTGVRHSDAEKSWRAALLQGSGKSKVTSAPAQSAPTLMSRFLNFRQDCPGRFFRSARGERKPGTVVEEIFHTTYDCPARVSIRPLNKDTKKKCTKKATNNLKASLNESRSSPISSDMPPWRQDRVYEIAVEMPSPLNLTQDDNLMTSLRRRLEKKRCQTGSKGSRQGRFPRSWELFLACGKLDGDLPLMPRPHPVFDLRLYGATPVVFGARLVMILLPLASAILLSAESSRLGHWTDIHWLWKYGIILHWLYVFVNLLTIASTSILVTSVLIFPYVSGSFGLLFVYFRSLSTGRITFPARECRFVVGSIAACYIYVFVWLLVCVFKADKLAHRHWLSTFDRNWRPEEASWWWRPLKFQRRSLG